MAKWIVAALVVILLIVGMAWMNWRNSPMREIEKSGAAVESAKSWHYHTVRTPPGLPPDTIEKDTFCPSFQRTVQSGTDRNGAPIVFDTINYFGHSYSQTGGQWTTSGPGSVPIFECPHLAIGSDENSLPYDAILKDGVVRRGGVRDVEGNSCRDYEIAVATPHDTQEKEFHFSMCINEQDDLPRETRCTPPGAQQEGVSTYTQWNAMSEPQLPPGFPR
ncbi:MAG: hypothetical protein WA211_09750 [Candidatus Acidiferrales bacterium]